METLAAAVRINGVSVLKVDCKWKLFLMRIGIVSVNLKNSHPLLLPSSPQGTPPSQFAHGLLVHTVYFFLPVVAGISTVWWHCTVLEPDKWIFNQLHGRILRPSVPSQVQQQNDRDVLSFRYHSSVHCSLQYLQKVYGCCSRFFVTVNLWMYINERVNEPVLKLWRLKITVGIGTELLFDLILPKKQLPGITECIIFCFCFYRCKDTHCVQKYYKLSGYDRWPYAEPWEECSRWHMLKLSTFEGVWFVDVYVI